MKVILDSWQEQVLEHDGHLVLCTGRQVGKTTIMAIKAAEYMLAHPGSRIIIVSLTEDQAKLIIVMILDYLEKKDKKLIAKGKNKPTQNKVVLANKSSALARPVGNTGDAIRGFTGDVLIIDEASRMPELAFVSGTPTLMTTSGQIWMCSTPAGKQGYFYQAFINKNQKYKVFHISSEKVIQERVISESWSEKQRAESIKFLAEEKAEKTELQYGQEYLGLFLDELRRFFEDELIDRVCILEKDPGRKGERFLGVDIGRMYDPSAFEDILRDGKKYFHLDSQVTVKTPTTETQRKIIEMDNAVKYVKIGIDAGSGALGVGVYDNLMLVESIKRKLVAMNNRAISLERDGTKKQRLQKEDYYNNMKAMLENGELLLLNDDSVKASLRSVQWEITKEEDSNSKIKIFGNDTHICEGLVRAADLAKKSKSSNIQIYWV